MATLLHIDSSINGERSHSRKVTATFATAWRDAHPDGTYLYRDLGAAPLPHMDALTHGSHQVPESEHTAEQAAAYRASKAVGDEVAAADLIVIGAPMYNYTISSNLKSWLDHIAVPRFNADPQTNVGALTGKKLIVATSRGGSYAPGTPRESFDQQEPYLRTFFKALAADGDLTFLHTEMTLSTVVPALAQFKNIFDESREAAHAAARELAGV